MSAKQAMGLIKDGDAIWINAFLAIANPVDLNVALTRLVREGNGPRDLTVYCSAGFGDWSEDSLCEGYIADGAVSRVVLGHFSSMPATSRKALSGELEAYNLPLGVMSHMIRAAAGGQSSLYSKIGLNLFADPRHGGYKLNGKSTLDLVRLGEENGRECLIYSVPKVDIAFIKGSSADMRGNISFEDECATLDALSTAQAARVNGGKVIVQVSRIIDRHQRPRNVIIPGMLVDAIVVCKDQSQVVNVAGNNMSISGDVFAQGNEIEIWLGLLQKNMITNGKGREPVHEIIGQRAFRELKKGQVANIGIGIPELVGLNAVRENMLSEIFLTVESGATGGLPANGIAFGATIGADIIVDMAQQFDFYDGGGLDICFVGALEVDAMGNVNAHESAGKLSGIGGFANITQNSKNVVFCCTFSAKGLVADIDGTKVKIISEGQAKKFVSRVHATSFSAHNALKNGQNVLYVTERCVFRLTPGGLELCEIADGVDLQKDILRQLPFPVSVPDHIRPMF